MDDREDVQRYVSEDGTGWCVEARRGEPIAVTVLRGIATIRGVEPTDLDCDAEHVAFDALESLVDHANRHNNSVGVRFEIDEYTVYVEPDEPVRIFHDPQSTLVEVGS